MKTFSEPGRKTVVGLLTRLIGVVALVLPACVVQAGVVFTNLYTFTNGIDGSDPNGLVQGSDGNLYGTTWFGGSNGYGTVFKISTSGAFSSLHSFTGGNDGWFPLAGLVQGSDGYFYGTTCGYIATNSTTFYGGGNVFKISTNGALTGLFTFGITDGATPNAGLVEGSDGDFYGTTLYNAYSPSLGAVPFGTVFKITTNGALTSLHSFTGYNGGDGANPNTVLVKGSDGDFYGTTPSGGASGGSGTMFKISPDGALTSLYTFTNGGPNGLVQGGDGNLYGTVFSGGANNDGTVFRISTNGVLTTLYAFGTITNSYGEPLDGQYPFAGLVQGSDGNFYGTTEFSGTNGGGGTVFRITTNGVLTSLHSFDFNDGANPLAKLVQGSDGDFYGTTSSGGPSGNGTIFRLSLGLSVMRAAPVFQSVTLTNGTLSLNWITNAGGTYQLQYSSDLRSRNWINLSNAVTATGATLSTKDFATNGPQRFYRLVFLP